MDWNFFLFPLASNIPYIWKIREWLVLSFFLVIYTARKRLHLSHLYGDVNLPLFSYISCIYRKARTPGNLLKVLIYVTTGFHGTKIAIRKGKMMRRSLFARGLTHQWLDACQLADSQFCSSQGSEGPRAITTEGFLQGCSGKSAVFARPPSHAGWHLGGMPFLKVRWWKQLLSLPEGLWQLRHLTLAVSNRCSSSCESRIRREA